LGQISIVAFQFAPRGWAMCSGQLLSIQQNAALFALLGTYYGGDGVRTFALPDLRGRVPVHVGAGFTQGQVGGQETHTLTSSELPAHSHVASGTANQATTNVPSGNVLAEKPRRGINVYAGAPTGGTIQPLATAALTTVGGGQPHDNLQPSLVLNFVIALVGIFPSRS